MTPATATPMRTRTGPIPTQSQTPEIEIAGRESETPDLLEEHELPPLDAEDLRHLDPTDAADYERRRLHGHGHLERAHGWSEEDW